MFLRVVTTNCILYVLILFKPATIAQSTQDQTSPRANTLLDDADDIQKQLDNEAKDRIKYGKPKTIWVFHLPTQFPHINAVETVTRPLTKLREQIKGNVKREFSSTCSNIDSSTDLLDWNYKNQNTWHKTYPFCGGRSQSPVDLPYQCLIKTKGGRKLVFRNYDDPPLGLSVQNDGRTVTLRGKWNRNRKPLIYGGAAHSRRYIFHSITLHWPSEHSVGGLQYPMESQVLHMSAEYRSFEEAINASSRDPQAFLGVANLYMYGNSTQEGLKHILKAAKIAKFANRAVIRKPLTFYNPPFKEYACYQGSLTIPPCTESVIWLIRAKALLVTRETVKMAQDLLDTHVGHGSMFFRTTQPLNDRKVYFLNN